MTARKTRLSPRMLAEAIAQVDRSLIRLLHSPAAELSQHAGERVVSRSRCAYEAAKYCENPSLIHCSW